VTAAQTMSPERREYRLTFTHVERGLHLQRPLVLSRHPSETPEHLTLRVLSWMLLWEEGLDFGPGVCIGDAPDLVAHDLIGAVSTWIACGDISPQLARKIVQHNRQAQVHVVFGGQSRRDAFVEAVAAERGERPKGWERLTLWTVDEDLVASLAQRQELRQRWTATLVGDHFYAEVNGESFDGAVTRG
jgi:uncharacterized protein YaeQ